MADIIYVATGEKYYKEALLSARSLLDRNPQYSIHIVSDRHHVVDNAVHFIQLENPSFSYRDKIIGLQIIEFDKFIFIDSDTYIIDSIAPVFDVLSRFDLAAALCEVRITPTSFCAKAKFNYSDIPVAFPELNTGVIGFRNSPNLKKFFHQWLEQYDAENLDKIKGWPDQPSFRKTLFNSSLRYCALPSEFNCRLPFCGYYEMPVVVLHGRRNQEGFLKFAGWINKTRGPRVYFPRLFVLPQNAGFVRVAMTLRNYLTRKKR